MSLYLELHCFLGVIHVQAAQQNIPIYHPHLRTRLVTYFCSRARSLRMPSSQACPSDDQIGDWHPTSPYKLVTFICIRTHCSKSVFMIWHELCTKHLPCSPSLLYVPKCPTLLIFNAMQCQDILHFRNPTTSCSNAYPWIVHTSDIVLHPHCWCYFLLCSGHRAILLSLRRKQDALYNSEGGDMTTLGFDGDVPSVVCRGRSSLEDPRGRLIFFTSSFGSSQDQGSHFTSKALNFGSNGFLLPCLT